MGLALKSMSTDQFEASPEADERVKNAHIGDVAFLIRSIVGKSMAIDDVNLLAKAMTDIDGLKGHLTKAALVTRLVEFGRSRDRAEKLASAVMR